jgi:hypothetical protein
MVELMRRFFAELDAEQTVESVRKSFPELNASQAVESVHRFFPDLSVTQIADVTRRFFPQMQPWELYTAVRQVWPEGTDAVRSQFGEEFRPDRPFDGIIASLTREFGGNVADRGIVAISGPPGNISKYDPKNVADLEGGPGFLGNSQSDASICYDFRERKITATHYSIRTDSGSDCRPKSWAIEVSNDGSGWQEVDRRENVSETNGNGVTVTFPVRQQVEARMIRFHQIGKNHANDWYLDLSAFEIFGFLSA